MSKIIELNQKEIIAIAGGHHHFVCQAARNMRLAYAIPFLIFVAALDSFLFPPYYDFVEPEEVVKEEKPVVAPKKPTKRVTTTVTRRYQK